MPREAFFKLKKEKQDEIINAFINELISKRINEVSINKIVKAADISRGSFYLYFENFDDLYKYILSYLRNNLIVDVKNAILSGNTLFEVGLRMFDLFIEGFNGERRSLYHRVAQEMTPENIIFFIEGFDNENPMIFTKLADFKKFNIKSSMDFQIIIEAVIVYVVEKIIEVLVGYTNEKEARLNLIRMFEYYKRAFYK